MSIDNKATTIVGGIIFAIGIVIPHIMSDYFYISLWRNILFFLLCLIPSLFEISLLKKNIQALSLNKKEKIIHNLTIIIRFIITVIFIVLANSINVETNQLAVMDKLQLSYIQYLYLFLFSCTNLVNIYYFTLRYKYKLSLIKNPLIIGHLILTLFIFSHIAFLLLNYNSVLLRFTRGFIFDYILHYQVIYFTSIYPPLFGYMLTQ